MIDIILHSMLIAGIFLLGKQVVFYADPFFLTLIRMIPGGLCLLAYHYYVDRTAFKFDKHDIKYFFLLSLSVLMVDAFRLYGLRYISAPNGALLTALTPFVAALAAYLFLGQPCKRRQIGALIIGFMAILPVILNGCITETSCDFSRKLLGYSMSFISVIGIVLGAIISKKLTKVKGHPLLAVVGIGLVGGGLLALPLSLLFESWNPVPMTQPWTAF